MKKTELMSAAPYYCVIESPIGRLGFNLSQDRLIKLSFEENTIELKRPEKPLEKMIASQLQCYFLDAKFKFNMTYKLYGTTFQREVWHLLCEIPVGMVRTYKDLANVLKTSPRAIGQACKSNPLPLIVPCHRVIGQKNLGGFAGDKSGRLISIKKWLLAHEKLVMG